MLDDRCKICMGENLDIVISEEVSVYCRDCKIEIDSIDILIEFSKRIGHPIMISGNKLPDEKEVKSG